ncbi:MAG: tripartite tricarboxylate transporter TctB family protein [Paracoccus sp. (in: a-proteobacteria)]|uniref:tripartite tricarboxylate transporter TctB family protein n=1 Tax=Paracoccus sp. TaxID=267 RepID=UPI002E8AAA3C|nr:tripartite tricarboxylate transporter TctB family protein [Pseudomonadota bacterium]
MTAPQRSRFTRPETLTAVGLVILAAIFLIPTFDLAPMSALLPAAMLIGLIVLGLCMLIKDQRAASAGEPAKTVLAAPVRVLGAFALVLGYAVAVDLVGFYPATIVTVPLVAAAFGYRQPLGLAVATAIVVGGIWLIFSVGMSQEFPSGMLWEA